MSAHPTPDLAALRALLAALSPNTLCLAEVPEADENPCIKHDHFDVYQYDYEYGDPVNVACVLDEKGHFTRLAVAAVNALPALLDRIERAERDSVRLDWMERDHNARVFPALRESACDATFGVSVQHEEGKGFSPNGKIREAIDAARAARPEGGA